MILMLRMLVVEISTILIVIMFPGLLISSRNLSSVQFHACRRAVPDVPQGFGCGELHCPGWSPFVGPRSCLSRFCCEQQNQGFAQLMSSGPRSALSKHVSYDRERPFLLLSALRSCHQELVQARWINPATAAFLDEKAAYAR